MPVVKVIELIGVSKRGFDDAVNEAVVQAGKTVRNISGVKVLGYSAKVEKNRITLYKANVKVSFLVER
jgi:hypothetical protein